MVDSRHLETSFCTWPFTLEKLLQKPVVALINAIREIAPNWLISQWLNRLWTQTVALNIKLNMLTIAWTCTIFPTYLQNYSNAINLPITLKALSITDLSHVSRRSANLLNRCPTPIIRSVSLKVRIKLLHPFPLASHFSVLTEKPEACSVELFTRCFHFWKHHKLRNIIISAICYSSPKSIDAHLTNQFLSL